MPIPIPEKWTRGELVEFVKEVVGEVRAATDRTGMVACYQGTRSLELTFTVGHDGVGVFLVPYPAAIAEVMDDPDRNPYQNLNCSVRASMAIVGMPEPVSARAPHVWRGIPHEFMGRRDRDCDLCGLPDRAEVHKPAGPA